jgi:membrane fusion protein (multidrug efflux system)
MPNRIVIVSLCGLAAACCAAFLATSGRATTPNAPPPPVVDVVTLREEPVAISTELPGRTTAYQISEVRPQVSGVILRRLFTEGADVKQGQPLYQIDPASYQADLDSATAQLAKARAAVTSAQLTARRDRILAQASAVSRQDLDDADATLAQDQADVAAGFAAVELAKINLAYTKVSSPISGQTGRSNVTSGALVTSDQADALVTITQTNPIYVDATQPSAMLLKIKHDLASGMLLASGDGRLAVQLIQEDGTLYPQQGELQFTEVNVDTETDSVTMRAIFPNDDQLLLPGMFVRERIEEGVDPHAILVPQQAVSFNQQGQAKVLIVGADDKVTPRIVTADRAIGTNWLVTAGLAPGDRVIVAGAQRAMPGMTVTVRQQSAGTGAQLANNNATSATSDSN